MEKLLKVFIGSDPRQAVSYSVLQHSLVSRSSKPVQVTPLIISQLPISREGLTPFSYSRYMVPWLCDYKGWALFMDADMLVRDDISKLFDLCDDNYSIMVVKNSLRYEWPSVMLMNCAKCDILTPEYVDSAEQIISLDWLDESEIGEIPAQWNHLVGYDSPDPNCSLIHYTQGTPAFPETRGCEYESDWIATHSELNSFQNWSGIFAQSTHSKWFVRGFLPKLQNARLWTRVYSWLWYLYRGSADSNVYRPRSKG